VNVFELTQTKRLANLILQNQILIMRAILANHTCPPELKTELRHQIEVTQARLRTDPRAAVADQLDFPLS
jgi:hypothetical protein